MPCFVAKHNKNAAYGLLLDQHELCNGWGTGEGDSGMLSTAPPAGLHGAGEELQTSSLQT